MRLSKSKVNSYLKCPLEFKFQYIDEIEVPQNKYMALGSDVHRSLLKTITNYFPMRNTFMMRKTGFLAYATLSWRMKMEIWWSSTTRPASQVPFQNTVWSYATINYLLKTYTIKMSPVLEYSLQKTDV